MALRVVEYSKFSLAVFGDSKPIKDELKAIGGKFNAYLKEDGAKTPGWIIPIKNKADLDKLLAKTSTKKRKPENDNPDDDDDASSDTKTETPEANKPKKIVAAAPKPSTAALQAIKNSLRVVEYSKFSLAVFGDSKPIKDELKAIGGKFNPYLKEDGAKTPGWIIPIKNKAQLDKLLGKNDDDGASVDTEQAPKPETKTVKKKKNKVVESDDEDEE